jgi:osmotically inducible protein OsmC
MALSNELGQAGLKPERIATTATVTLESTDAGFAITTAHLKVSAKVPGAERQAFEAVANAAKAGCPVSKVLNAPITMEANQEA